MPPFAYGIVALAWIVWMLPFALTRRKQARAQKVDRRARWGILLVAISFAVLWQYQFWRTSLPAWRLTLAIFFLAVADVLSWTATRVLGKQWRVDAGLNAEHELVTQGPYRLVRHPIYTSVLCVLWGTGFILLPLPLILLATLPAVIGTEIRVRIEDGLLASRFGQRFEGYRRSVAAYVPFVR
ncbi:MAG: isoprenylcysteine carboxylmethyltransferase family protein [Bryobacteraceae bacterium]|jgi:protein-S-isoprenylcysteine O-methyltransferase Ste14